MPDDLSSPTIVPLGDAALLVRFGTVLSDAANQRAIAFAGHLARTALPAGVTEVAPNLVSVLLKYDPRRIGFETLAGEVRLLVSGGDAAAATTAERRIAVRYDGEDLDEVAQLLGLERAAFINAHTANALRVLATGFAPGFVYCGFHPPELVVARRQRVRPQVAAGTVLFAAGQTAIAATPIPTGWHVIGHTDFSNFDPVATPPTILEAGDILRLEAVR